MTTNQLSLFEVDISVPVQLFRIEYTLVEQGGLPFVPEFLLRLLKVSAFPPADIARFFGLTPKEVSTALLPFLQQGELALAADGRVALTDKGLRLFAGDGETPIVKGRKEYRKSFAFDLLAYSFVEHKKQRLESPRCSVVLSSDPSARAESVAGAERAFQHNLFKIYRSGELCGQTDEMQAPELYKVSEVRKERDGYIRFAEAYGLDSETMTFGFIGHAGLTEEDVYITQRSVQLAELVGRCNIETVAAFADGIGDQHTLDLLSAGALDLSRAAQASIATFRAGQAEVEPIYGALQLTRNWDRVERLLSKYAKRKASEDSTEPVSLTWLAPAAHGLWGKCSRHSQALGAFVGSATFKASGQEKSVFNPRLLIPLADQHDDKARRRAFNECKEAESVLHGFVESDALSALEVISLVDSFAIVIYHLVLPDVHPVPVPFGFITEDKRMVRRIEAAVEDKLAEYTEGNVPRYLGALSRNESPQRRRG
ncbi:hypothetical protein ACMYUJ_13130 [Stutzerimonas zhaodongensis]|uniref:hypothetical protein n=1 Tax=Stutzerimonas zhaodongensis TaxID=1176257 RepID=UPI0039EE4777